MALANLKADRGIKTIANNWENWNDIIKSSDMSLEDYNEIAKELEPALKDMLDLSDAEFEALPENFAQTYWNEIYDAISGKDGAVADLNAIAQEEINKAQAGKGAEVLLDLQISKDNNGLTPVLEDLNQQIASFDGNKILIGAEAD
jgi:hypothetical protein